MPKKKKKAKKLSSEQLKQARIQRQHRKEIRSAFTLSGFKRLTTVADRHFTYQDITSELDDCFILDNVIVFLEYTTKQQSDVGEHLKKKKVLYDAVRADPENFIVFCDDTFVDFKNARGDFFALDQYQIVIVYCSYNWVEKTLKNQVPGVKYLDYQHAKYFLTLARAIRTSARYELLEFLGLHHSDIGKNVIAPSSASTTYSGSLLPESHSYFGKDYKIVSFYVDPAALLSRCYVLRKDRWEGGSNLYQRMISKKKIDAIRKYLLTERRVFVNNIILTLPGGTVLVGNNGQPVDSSKLSKTVPIKVQLPSEYNSIGLIDGQHRVFSYYEGGKNEDRIALLREQQNLLVTGIIFPGGMTEGKRTLFEAKLFLEINSTQATAKSDLKQEIGLLLYPFSDESIAKDVLNHLNDNSGPLFDQFERFFFEKDRLKTTSVVSYALRPIVKMSGEDSLFSAWKQSGKDALLDGKDLALRTAYVEFCAKQLNQFLSAARACLGDRWTADKKEKNRLLTTTNINGLIICLRKTLETDKLRAFDYYRERFGTQLAAFPFGKFKSSQYTRMGQDLYEKFFA